MGTTSRGYPYPESTDNVRLWEHFQALANALNVDIGAVANRKMWTRAFTATSGTATTAGLVVTTVPAATYPAHTAFRLEFRGLVRGPAGSTATSATLSIRDTDASGTMRGDPFVFPILVANRTQGFIHYIANNTGADITGRVLCLTLTPDTSTAQINAGANEPWFLNCHVAGVDTDYPEAVAL
jgi:3D (Asp-Asp-Asp) domain-containing protein